MRFFIFTLLFAANAFAQSGGAVYSYLRLQPSTLPSTCHLGDLRFDTSTSVLQFCNGSNTWNQYFYGSGSLPVSQGGTGTTTFTAHGVLVGEGTSAIKSTAAGSSGQCLISGGSSADPAYGTLGVSGGGLGLTSGTSGGILGFTATGTLTSSSLLTANQLLIGGGAGSTPSALAAGSQYQPLVMGTSNPGYAALALNQSAAVTGTLPTGNGGTGVASVTVSPTATSFAGWDANSNLSANAFIGGYATTVTAAGTTTLSVASAEQQYFTGSTTQTVKLPVVSTLVLGQQFYITNTSTGAVTVVSSGLNSIQVLAAASYGIFTVISTTGTTAASWSFSYATAASGGGSVTSVAATVPSVLSISGSPITGAGTLAIGYSGTALPTANGGTGQTALNSTVFTTLFETIATTGGDLLYGGTSGAPTRLANGTSGQLLQSAGSTSAPTWSTLPGNATALHIPTVQKFTSGTGTYTLPTSPSPLYIKVSMVGGGGGGVGSGTSPGASANGGTSTFGTTLLSAVGGIGSTNENGGAGGTASLGTGPIGYALQGGTGGTAPNVAAGAGGSGGNTCLGGGGTGGSGGGGGGGNGATNTGGGGGGAGASAVAGSGGGGGGGCIEAIITSPSSTYSYTVGGTGAGGTAGSGGQAGGTGGSGLIVVWEYYQ